MPPPNSCAPDGIVASQCRSIIDGEWEQQPARTSDVRNLCADAKLAKELLGFEPQIDFKEGLAQTLDWYTNKQAGGADFV